MYNPRMAKVSGRLNAIRDCRRGVKVTKACSSHTTHSFKHLSISIYQLSSIRDVYIFGFEMSCCWIVLGLSEHVRGQGEGSDLWLLLYNS